MPARSSPEPRAPRRRRSGGRRRLLLATVGDGSRHRAWTRGSEERSFDVVLVDYGSGGGRFASDADRVFERRGTKFRLIRWALDRIDVDRHDAFFFPDDDLEFAVEDVNRLFDVFEARDLSLAQPSLDAASLVSYEITRTAPGNLLRYTNFVEVMCPVFSRAALAVCVVSFELTESNWGLDVLWPRLLGDPQDRIAIVDAVSVRHARPPRADYSWCSADPEAELEAVCRAYGVSLAPKVLGAVPLPPG